MVHHYIVTILKVNSLVTSNFVFRSVCKVSVNFSNVFLKYTDSTCFLLKKCLLAVSWITLKYATYVCVGREKSSCYLRNVEIQSHCRLLWGRFSITVRLTINRGMMKICLCGVPVKLESLEQSMLKRQDWHWNVPGIIAPFYVFWHAL